MIALENKKLFVDLHPCIQGEGKFAGYRAILARVGACNLDCIWCDTSHASTRGEMLRFSIHELLNMSENTGITTLLLTGGEPMLFQRDLRELPLFPLAMIETNGTIRIKDFDIRNYFLSISPKLSTSGRNSVNLGVIDEYMSLAKDFQLKFVITDAVQDLKEIREIQRTLKVPLYKIALMPNATNRRELMRNARPVYELCLKEGYVYSDRLQVRMYGNRRGV